MEKAIGANDLYAMAVNFANLSFIETDFDKAGELWQRAKDYKAAAASAKRIEIANLRRAQFLVVKKAGKPVMET